MQKTSLISRVAAGIFLVNFCLFGVKLYIGLSSNSIAVFSDAVNNLFDALSSLITGGALWLLSRQADALSQRQLNKTEQLFSLLTALIVVFTGFYFAYSSLERFMYPTPVWHTARYAVLLGITAAVKLGLFFVVRVFARRSGADVLRVIAFDSLLDCFITCGTVLTLLLSGGETFSFDALFGLIISVVIVVSAVRMLLSAGAKLTDHVPIETRRALSRLLAEQGAAPAALSLVAEEEGIAAYARFREIRFDAAALEEKVLEETGVRLFCIEQKERNLTNESDKNG